MLKTDTISDKNLELINNLSTLDFHPLILSFLNYNPQYISCLDSSDNQISNIDSWTKINSLISKTNESDIYKSFGDEIYSLVSPPIGFDFLTFKASAA